MMMMMIRRQIEFHRKRLIYHVLYGPCTQKIKPPQHSQSRRIGTGIDDVRRKRKFHKQHCIKSHTNFTTTTSSSSSSSSLEKQTTTANKPNNDKLPPPPKPSFLQVHQFPASEVDFDDDDEDNKQHHDGGILYKATAVASDKNKNIKWEKVDVNESTSTSTTKTTSSNFNNVKLLMNVSSTTNKKLLSHFLPAKYPKSVAPEYMKFVTYCFTASVAGSAAMVLSTQTLLLAVGVVGSTGATHQHQQASIMAGALNWVMKDFIGQLGGVLFASQMGKTKAFDTDPKRWRMVSAMTLDCATLIEILSPLFVSTGVLGVLPVASIANISKNIGFLTASASRAALHNAVAISGNLGDVTAKSGSQSIMASLLGTSLGIGLSSLLSHDTYNFTIGFIGLAIIHQGCNYKSVKCVALKHFNRHRLHLLIDEYFLSSNKIILTPSEIATKESFFPLLPSDDTKSWLKIGQPLEIVYPNPIDFENELQLQQKQKQKQKRSSTMSTSSNNNNDDDEKEEFPQSSSSNYMIRCNNDDTSSSSSKKNIIIYLNFMKDATGEDLIRGMFHSHLIYYYYHHNLLNEKNDEKKEKVDVCLELVEEQLQIEYPKFLLGIQQKGWKTDTQVTTIESSKAQRLSIIKVEE